MADFFKLSLVALGLTAVSGCVTYPYETSFSACDNAAGLCYRACEDYRDTPDYGRCHADCEFSADRCFASAYEPYRYSYGYSSPWYGNYGSWYPNSGYAFSFGYYNYDYYGRDRYRRHRYHPPRDRDRHRDRDRDRQDPPRYDDPSYARDRGDKDRIDRPDEDLARKPGPSAGSPSRQPAPPPPAAPQAQPQPEPQAAPARRTKPTPSRRRPPNGEPDRDKE